MEIAALVFDFDGLILDTEWSEFVTVQAEFARPRRRARARRVAPRRRPGRQPALVRRGWRRWPIGPVDVAGRAGPPARGRTTR